MAIPLRIAPQLRVATKTTSSRKDIRLWLGVTLILIATLSGGKLFAATSHRTPAVILTHDLSAGSVISAGDVQIQNVALPAGIESVTEVNAAIGKFVTHDVIAGTVLHPLAMSDVESGQLRSVSVPIRAGHFPHVSYGSSIDIWFTPSLDGAVAPGPSQLLASNVLVAEVPQIIDSAVDAAITLRVPSDVVPQIVQAMRDGFIDIAVVGADRG